MRLPSLTRQSLRLALASTMVTALMAIGAAPASATSFRLPLNGCTPVPPNCRIAFQDSNGDGEPDDANGDGVPDVSYPCYITAYKDNNGRDWNCGAMHYQGHSGTDFGALGTINERPVVAAAAGTVTVVSLGCEDNGSWGNTCGGGLGNHVKIKHADGKVTWYGHMAKGSVRVQKDDAVTCGQVLGKVGNSGNSTGPHLHLEVVTPQYGSDDPFGGPCGGDLRYWVDQGTYCHLPKATCEGACTPQCSGKVCGGNGCGGSCGTCAAGSTCNSSGQCVSGATDGAQLVSQTVPAGTKLQPGEVFTKTWTVKNTGTTTWTRDAYVLVHASGATFEATTAIWLDANEQIAPGATKTFSVSMKAPRTAGTYQATWRIEHTNAARFGDALPVSVVVEMPVDYDAIEFVEENLPDDTHVPPGSAFVKRWTLRNVGTTKWSRSAGYVLAWSHGERFDAAPQVNLEEAEIIEPGESKVWEVEMTAPTRAGTYRGYWQMLHSDNTFHDPFWIQLIVDPSAQPQGPYQRPDAGDGLASGDGKAVGDEFQGGSCGCATAGAPLAGCAAALAALVRSSRRRRRA